MRRTPGNAALALALSCAAGCVLFVSPDTYGEHCKFAGESSQCGACIAEHCRGELDQCCGDSACEPTMRALDACTTRHDASCNDLRSPATALGRCVASSCAPACAALNGTSLTTCREPHLGEGSVCTCEAATSGSNDFVCSSDTYPDTICCAPEGSWPAPGLECTCSPLSCTGTPDGCFCSLVNFTPKSRACEGQSLHCCANEDVCDCRRTACNTAFETEVPSCDVRAVGCKKGQMRVSSCSQRREP